MSNEEKKENQENPPKTEEPKQNLNNPEIKVEEQKILEEIPEPKDEGKTSQPIVEETKPRKKKKTLMEESKTEIKKVKHEVPLKITDPVLKTRLEYSKLISPLRFMTKTQKKKEMKMTEEEKEKNRKILYNMNLKLNFVKNPRYRNNIPPPRYIDTNFQPINSPENAFSIEPQEVIFKDYQSGSIYQIDLKILNRTQLLTSFKYIPPVTEFFTIKSVIYPKKDSSLIAPGMYAKMQVLFYAQTMDNFEDEIIIMTEKIAFKVPLRAIRDKPAIILKNPLDCGKCLVGDKIERHFICKNNGGDAHFKFYIEEEKENNNNNLNNNSKEKKNISNNQTLPQEEMGGALQNNSVSNELWLFHLLRSSLKNFIYIKECPKIFR